MRYDRLMELLDSFSSHERERFRLFVASPYFSAGSTASVLLEHCLTALETPKESWPDRAALYTALFPGAPLIKGKLEKHLGVLYDLATHFLVTEQYHKPENEPDRQLALTHEFQTRRLQNHSGAMLTTIRRSLKQPEKINYQYFLRKLQLTLAENDQIFIQPSKKNRFTLNEGFEALYLLYQTMKLELAVVTSSIKSRFTFEDSELAKQMLAESVLNREILFQHPMLYLSMQYLRLVGHEKPDRALLNQFVAAIRQQEHLMVESEVRSAWTMARNIANYWLGTFKDQTFGHAFLEIALDNLSNGLLYHNGLITHYTLESLCKVALEIQMPEVALRVLEEYRNRIAGEQPDEPFFRYNMARYHFYTGNLEEALAILPHKLPDESYHLFLRILEIQILYEMDSPLLDYRMDALRLFLRRSHSATFPAERLRECRLFLNALARICHCPQGNSQRAEAIMRQIRANPHRNEYFWLLKIASLKTAHPQKTIPSHDPTL